MADHIERTAQYQVVIAQDRAPPEIGHRQREDVDHRQFAQPRPHHAIRPRKTGAASGPERSPAGARSRRSRATRPLAASSNRLGAAAGCARCGSASSRSDPDPGPEPRCRQEPVAGRPRPGPGGGRLRPEALRRPRKPRGARLRRSAGSIPSAGIEQLLDPTAIVPASFVPPSELTAEPGPREPPVPLDRDQSRSPVPRRPRELSTRRIPQGHHLGQAPFHSASLSRASWTATTSSSCASRSSTTKSSGHAPPSTSAPLGRPPPRVVDQYLPHGPRGRREQVTPVRRLVENRFAQQPNHCLVDHCRGREGMAGSFPSHQPRGHAAQLVVNHARSVHL